MVHAKTMINSGETQIKILIIPYIQKHIVKGKKILRPGHTKTKSG